MNAKAETQSVTLEYELPHSPAKVWRALTEPELLSNWLMVSDLKPVAGHRFTFKDKPMPWWDGVVHCEVQEVEPHKRLRYSWRSGAGNTLLDTVVTWTLTPTASGGTRLALEHSGFLPNNAFAADGAGKGWQRMINERLRELLARAT
jgi:uncharacterized protein YndB with AHSA1/START domain